MPKSKKTKSGIQTGRNLPHRFESYSPAAGKLKPKTAPAAEPPPSNTKPWLKHLKRSALGVLAVFLLAVLVIGIWDARNISQAENKLFGTGNILKLIGSSDLHGSGRGRVNILLVGYSVDDPGHPGAKLTDSIMLLSLSTTHPSGYMLSIPRDLYVNIPGFGYSKINEAYQDGGISLLKKVVSADFEQPVDYYALIDYSTVRDTVNSLGGITVCIKSTDPRGLYDPNINKADGGPLKLSNGCQKLDGQTALNLSRARGDPAPDGRIGYGFAQSDFDRTEHQRQILAAIKAKLNWTLILNPRKNSRILDAVADNVKTDVRAGDIRHLFSLFNSIPGNKLKSFSLRNLGGKNYLSSYSTPSGQSALIPSAGLDDYSQIDAALLQISQ